MHGPTESTSAGIVRLVLSPVDIASSLAVIDSGSRGRNRLQRSAHGWKQLEQRIEATDLKHFLDHGLQSRENHLAVLLTALLCRDHEHAKAGAANENYPAKIQDQYLVFSGATRHVRRQRIFKSFCRRMIYPPIDLDQDNIGDFSYFAFHNSTSGYFHSARGVESIQSRASHRP